MTVRASEERQRPARQHEPVHVRRPLQRTDLDDRRQRERHALLLQRQRRLTSTNYANGSVSSATYNSQGNPLTTSDADGQVIDYVYNAEGQIISENLSDETTETFSYDAHGSLVQTTDPTGTTTYTYNVDDELTGVIQPGGLSLAFTYDAAGAAHQHRSDRLPAQLPVQFPGTPGQHHRQHPRTIVSYAYDADGRCCARTWATAPTRPTRTTPTDRSST